MCGVKANEGTIGVTAQVLLGECGPSTNLSTHVSSIARWSQLKNKRTGVVTNTRITHASPTGKLISLLNIIYFKSFLFLFSNSYLNESLNNFVINNNFLTIINK